MKLQKLLARRGSTFIYPPLLGVSYVLVYFPLVKTGSPWALAVLAFFSSSRKWLFASALLDFGFKSWFVYGMLTEKVQVWSLFFSCCLEFLLTDEICEA
jgi:hypothetical protein